MRPADSGSMKRFSVHLQTGTRTMKHENPYATVESYGFVKLASLGLSPDGEASISILDPSLCASPKGIYAWIIGDVLARIGSTQAPLADRARQQGRWITLRLQNKSKLKNMQRRERELADALRWKALLDANAGQGEMWGRPGTVVTTPVGEISTYLAEENVLLRRHRPPLNNSHFR